MARWKKWEGEGGGGVDNASLIYTSAVTLRSGKNNLTEIPLSPLSQGGGGLRAYLLYNPSSLIRSLILSMLNKSSTFLSLILHIYFNLIVECNANNITYF